MRPDQFRTIAPIVTISDLSPGQHTLTIHCLHFQASEAEIAMPAARSRNLPEAFAAADAIDRSEACRVRGEFVRARHEHAQRGPQRTRQRRKECDAVDVSGGFRALMRWRPTVMEGQ